MRREFRFLGCSSAGRSSALSALAAAFALALVVGACNDPPPNGGAPPPDLASASADAETVLRFARSVAHDALSAAEGADVAVADREREVKYASEWIERLLPEDVWRSVRYSPERFRCVSGVGPAGDDAIVVSGTIDGWGVDVVDSRVLILQVRPGPGFDGLGSVVDRFVNCSFHAPRGSVKWTVETLSTGARGESGLIRVDRGDHTAWFTGPIVWSVGRDGEYILVVNKLMRPPSSRGPLLPKHASRHVDGVPVGDPRVYRRFAHSNREELSQSRFGEIPQHVSDGSAPMGLRRRPGTTREK